MFDGADSFETSVRAVNLANKFGIEIQTKSEGLHWAHIVVDDSDEAISFFKPSHAYAYLLGVKAGMKVKDKS